ncbi:MAG: hypothetical protein Q7R33_02880 [Nitrosarchaeum sp.]|nr:hypothetical protein [Nitrosarchaeum sp.]
MLNTLLEKPMSHSQTLYCIGRSLGLFPKDSYQNFKHLFTEESDNDIEKTLSSILRQLTSLGQIITVDDNKIQWNGSFHIDTHLEHQAKKKTDRANHLQAIALTKKTIRKYLMVGKDITDGGPNDLVFVIREIDFDNLLITTNIVRSNGIWTRVFAVNEKVVWHYNISLGDQIIFEASSKNKEANEEQSLLYLHTNGTIIIDRDS